MSDSYHLVKPTLSPQISKTSGGPRWIYMTLGIIPVWTFVTNGVVLIAFFKDKSLRNNLANVIIASLTMADFFLSILVLPLAVYYKVNGHWELGFALKLLWFCLDVLFSAGSIMNLCVISVYRYLAIAYPYRIRYGMSRRHVILLLGIAWGIAGLASLSVMTESLITNAKAGEPSVTSNSTNTVLTNFSVNKRLTESSLIAVNLWNESGKGIDFWNDKINVTTSLGSRTDTPDEESGDSYMEGATPFLIYGSILTFFLPLAIMTFTAIRSIQLLKRQSTFNGALHRRSEAVINLNPHEEMEEEDEDAEEEDEKEKDDENKLAQRKLNNMVGTIDKSRNSQIRFAPPASPNKKVGADIASDRRLSQTAAFSSDSSRCTESGSCSLYSPKLLTPSASVKELPTGPMTRRTRSMSVPFTHSSPSFRQHLGACGKNDVTRKSNESTCTNDGNQINARNRYRRRLTLIFTGHRPSVFSVHSKEQRAIRTLLMVFIVFAVCWSPFFIVQIIVAFTPPNAIFNEILFDLAWPGFASSGLNPVIYTIFNPEYKVSVTALLMDFKRFCFKSEF